MAAINDITGDSIITKRSSVYADNYGNIDFSVKLESVPNDEHLNLLLKDDADGFNSCTDTE